MSVKNNYSYGKLQKVKNIVQQNTFKIIYLKINTNMCLKH